MDEKKNTAPGDELQPAALPNEQENTANLVQKVDEAANDEVVDSSVNEADTQGASVQPETSQTLDSQVSEPAEVVDIESEKEATVPTHDSTTSEPAPSDEASTEPTQVAVPTPTIEQTATVAAGAAASSVVTSTGGSHRKRLIIIAIVTVVVLVAVGLVLKLTVWNDKTVKEDTDASVQKVQKLGVAVTLVDGDASYRHGEGEWQTLATTTELAEGDDVRTAENGRVVLTFDDGSALRLDHKSNVALTSLAAKDIHITQSEGTAYSRVVASDRSYIVTVDKVNYQALGTAFVTVNNETEKGVQVYHSKVKVDGIADAVVEGKQYYKQHGNDALKGKVSDLDLDALAGSDFVDWNTTEDEKEASFKEKLGVLKTIREKRELAREAPEKPAQSSPQQPSASLQLTGSATDKGAALNWTVTGVDVASGFKVVRSASSQTPTFGRDDAVYVDKSTARSYTWSTKKAGTYWYRVCAYRPAGGSCVNYSNAVQVTTTGSSHDDDKDGEKVTRGNMTLAVDGSGNATWSYTGVAVHGYKLVMSKSQNPTYPDNSVAYFDRSKTSGSVSLIKFGTYYLRICAWTNGSESEPCVDYSNQVTVTKN